MLTFAEISLMFRNEREEKKFPGLSKVWDYLGKRGIDEDLANRLGLHIMLAAELIAAARGGRNAFSNDTRAAVVFPHWKLGQSEHIEWWSSRLVDLNDAGKGPRLVASFGDYVDVSKQPVLGKMFCPPNEAPHGYIPPETVFPWSQLGEGDNVYIHESAIKAINGAILGFPSIGLNGVWGWGSRKNGIALIDELRSLPWKAKKLNPVIVYDSNAWDNWQVQEAETALAAKLFEITGQRSRALRVPKRPDGENQGFDDFVLANGPGSGSLFLRGEWPEGGGFVDIEISELQRRFLQLNNEVCLVESANKIYHQTDMYAMSRASFVDLNYAHYTAEIETDGGVRRVNVPKLWLADERRRTAKEIVYEPGQPKFTDGNLNSWTGMGVDPDMGAKTDHVSPWLDLLVNNVQEEETRKLIIAWLAYPLQNPGAKLATYMLVFGPQGTGKNLFFLPFHRIYGRNAVTLDNDAIKSSFTSLYANRQFVHCDELMRVSGDRENITSQRVKMMVTSEKVKFNMKGQPEYEVNNHINLAITSNYVDCIHLDSDDRRAIVLRWGEGIDRRGDQIYWKTYVDWCEQGGAESLYGWLLSQDISWFDPDGWAPSSDDKAQLIDDSSDAMEGWVRDLWVNPDDIIPPLMQNKLVWSSRQLAVLFYNLPEVDITPGKVKALAKHLSQAGFKYACKGERVREPSGAPQKWWMVKERGKRWTHEDLVRHLRVLSRTS